MKAWDHPLIKKGMPLQLAKRRARIAAGEKPFGWKVGLGAPATMEKIGTAAPLVSYLMHGVYLPSGATVSFRNYVKPVVEPEIAVRMGRDLGAGATAAETLAAIKEIGPAIEVVDSDLVTTADNIDVALEGGLFQRHVVLGDKTRAGGSVAGLTSRTTRNGQVVETTTNPEALTGKMLDVIAHVANTLAAFGEKLSAGDTIITGSITLPQIIEAGEKGYTHALDPIGEVTINFVWQ
ncbi:MAG: fumarylacetoacetate hydrolase family protein [Pseudolabrys sp.]